MGHINDILNQRFGKLLVIKFTGMKRHGIYNSAHWDCICDCGRIKNFRGNYLTSGGTTQCGSCHNRSKLSDREFMTRRLFHKYKMDAYRREYKWGLSIKDFAIKISGKCYYCNTESSNCMKEANRKLIYNGIDRINNEPYYININTVSCCKLCNMIKRDLKLEDFLSHIEKLYKIREKIKENVAYEWLVEEGIGGEADE